MGSPRPADSRFLAPPWGKSCTCAVGDVDKKFTLEQFVNAANQKQTKSPHKDRMVKYTTYHSPTLTLRTMIGHQRLRADRDMNKFALQKDNADRNRDRADGKGRAQQTPLFSALMLTNFNKNKWLYVLFKRHMLNRQVKTTKS